MAQKEKTNPLLAIWRVISTISGIIGMVALADDVVAWKSFLPKIVASYKSIVHPIFEFLLGWIPVVNIPNWIHDYLFIGVLVAGSDIRAWMVHPVKVTQEDTDAFLQESRVGKSIEKILSSKGEEGVQSSSKDSTERSGFVA